MKKKKLVFLFPLLLFLVAIAGDIFWRICKIQEGGAQETEIWVSWDAPLSNVDGTPYEDHSHYNIAYANPGMDLNSGGTPVEVERVDCGTPTCSVPLRNTFGGTLPSSLIGIWVQAVDLSGNESIWAGGLIINLDKEVPNPPRNVRKEEKPKEGK